MAPVYHTMADNRDNSALVALSGGVDSSTALMIALREYDTVRAAYVDVIGEGPNPFAVEVAGHFGVELINCKVPAQFSKEVIEPSVKMSRGGFTPNPCALCNARIKFATLFELLKPGEVLITGHYAINTVEGIFRGSDITKDQSYFLSLVRRSILKRCRFPLGEMIKRDVRKKAEKNRIPFRRDESMDLCFEMPYIDEEPGNILDIDGNCIGQHDGIHSFTVGQRKGLGAFGSRKYVVSINPESSSIVIGDKSDLLSSGCTAGELNVISTLLGEKFQALVQIRYRRKPVNAEVEVHRENNLTIHFNTPEQAVAPGQVCAVYLDNRLLCGSIITSTVKLLRGE